jgi:hypothetical protein
MTASYTIEVDESIREKEPCAFQQRKSATARALGSSLSSLLHLERQPVQPVTKSSRLHSGCRGCLDRQPKRATSQVRIRATSSVASLHPSSPSLIFDYCLALKRPIPSAQVHVDVRAARLLGTSTVTAGQQELGAITFSGRLSTQPATFQHHQPSSLSDHDSRLSTLFFRPSDCRHGRSTELRLSSALCHSRLHTEGHCLTHTLLHR